MTDRPVKASGVTDVVADLGKTRCRAAATQAGRINRAAAPIVDAGAPGLATAGGVAAAERAVMSVVARVDERPRSITVGAAGALTNPAAAAELAGELSRFTTRMASVTSDAVTAHAGALGGATGIVIVAGTGAVAIGIDPTGGLALGDGAGPVEGDRGGGAWLGHAALRRAREGSPSLRAAAERRYGPSWTDLADKPLSYETARATGEFVPDVLAVARAGDDAARSVIGEAAGHLGTTTLSVVDQLAWGAERPRIVVLGGLTHLGEALFAPLRHALPDLRISEAEGDALDGAALLATTTDLPHEAQVHREGT